jgi:hypothetical protein
MDNRSLKHAFLKENPNYIIYNDGRLFSIKSGKWITPKTYTGGYLLYTIRVNGKTVGRKVHRLVAEYFVFNPKPEAYNEVNHKDEDRTNNNANNLEWCDRKYNTYYSQTWKKANELNQIKIAKCNINTHEIIEEYPSIRIAARKNNCTEQNIGRVTRGKQKSACGYYWIKL